MEIHVNGWKIIEKQLTRLEKRQGDLARLWQMTPAAVSQIKKGIFLLNPRQLEATAIFLGFDEEMRSAFYSELFNARLLARKPDSGREELHYRVVLDLDDDRAVRRNEVPVADLRTLGAYRAALEAMADFLLRNSPERKPDAPPGAGVCALRVGKESAGIGLRPGSLILLESGRYPEPGKLHLIGLRDGKLFLRRYNPEGDRVVFETEWRDSGKDFILENHEIPKLIHWIVPVIECSSRY